MFQKIINKIFYDMLNEGIIAFFNNILIHMNSTKQVYEICVCKVLDCLVLKYILYIVIEKYQFSVSELSYLSYILFSKEVCMDPAYIEAVLDQLVSKNKKKKVQQFNWLANFYWCFIKSYTHIYQSIMVLGSPAIFN